MPDRHTHGDRTPSASVSPERGSFKCWVCPDVRGDVIDLVKLVKGCSFREALQFLGAPADAPRGRARPRPPSAGPSTPAHGETPAPAAGHPNAADAAAADKDDTDLRRAILAELLRLASPVQGAVARYLQKRRIFRRTWDSQHLRMVDDYAGMGSALEKAFGRADLQLAGFFNAAGHLRYYRHRLLFPYLDRSGKPVYLQARGVEDDVKPKELSMAGAIPMPYNVRLLDGEPGQIYLCEGVIDTLTLIEQGFPAVGVPGAANFKPAWAALFRNKSVHVAFDPDAPGENGAARAIEILQAVGVEARRLAPPEGLDLNDWFRKG
jgi:DNA primase